MIKNGENVKKKHYLLPVVDMKTNKLILIFSAGSWLELNVLAYKCIYKSLGPLVQSEVESESEKKKMKKKSQSSVPLN